ncbi:MAG: mycofactocin precursor MftA [Actinomycetota bacterium]|nr:mycofactocin precursor MftA [Actinomycetota bacterium]
MFLGSPQEDAALQSPPADSQVETLIEDISIDGMCGVY